jgi:uncharacterized protein HemX
MKKMVLLVIAVVGGLVGYNYFTTGNIALRPSLSSSPEAEQLSRLRSELREAKRNFRRASQTTAVTAADTTPQIEHARDTARRIQAELGVLQSRIKDGATRKRADALLAETQQFLRMAQ